MRDDAIKLVILNIMIGETFSNSLSKAKYMKKNGESWPNIVSKDWKKNYKLYYKGRGMIIILMMLSLSILLIYTSDFSSIALLTNIPLIVLVFIFIVSGISMRSMIKKEIVKFLDNHIEVDVVDGTLYKVNRDSTVSWNLDGCTQMLDCEFGFVLIFSGSTKNYLALHGTQEYKKLYTEVRNQVDKNVYQWILF